MRLVDDEVVRLGQQRAAHARVLQQQRVVRHDDARARRRFARALQIAAARDARAATRVARLVVGGDATPQIALRPEEI